MLRITKTSEFPLNLRCGIAPRETFAVKSMEVNFNLMKLKLDMVYRDISPDEAQKRFAEATAVPETADTKATGEIGTAVLESTKKPKRKVVKALVPKNK